MFEIQIFAFCSRYNSRYGFLTPYLQLAPRRWGTARTELGSSHSSWKGSRLLSTPATAACLASKQTAYPSLPCKHESEGYAACFDEVVARAVRVSQPAVLSALLVIQLSGIVIPPPNFSKEHQKERCGHFSAAALLHYVLWCASEYSVVGRISCNGSMIVLEQALVNDPL